MGEEDDLPSSSAAGELKQEADHLEPKKDGTSSSKHRKLEASLAASHEIPDKAVAINIQEDDNDDDRLAVQIQDSIDQLDKHLNFRWRRCVDRVPDRLLEGNNEKYYRPRVVSIGPFHYGKEKYTAMEKIKIKILDVVIKESTMPRSFYINVCRQFESVVRDYYPKEVMGEELQSVDNFVKMMLVDGAFIIKFMQRQRIPIHFMDNDGKLKKRGLTRQQVADVKHDLTLVENQLPFHFLQTLNGILSHYTNLESRKRSITTWKEDTISIAACTWPHLVRNYQMIYQLEPVHLLDLLRGFMLPSYVEPPKGKVTTCVCGIPIRSACGMPIRLAHAIRDRFARETPSQMTNESQSQFAHQMRQFRLARGFITWNIKSAMRLQEMGVQINSTRDANVIAHFTHRGKKLTILQLKIDDTSQMLFRNIMALEQCYYLFDQFVSDYLILLEMLIRNNSESLLVYKEVIINNLTADGDTAAAVLRDVCKNIEYANHPFGMADLCIAINEYCDRPTTKLRVACRRFAWQIGGAIIVFLTLIQTICSVLALFNIASERST